MRGLAPGRVGLLARRLRSALADGAGLAAVDLRAHDRRISPARRPRRHPPRADRRRYWLRRLTADRRPPTATALERLSLPGLSPPGCELAPASLGHSGRSVTWGLV